MLKLVQVSFEDNSHLFLYTGVRNISQTNTFRTLNSLCEEFTGSKGQYLFNGAGKRGGCIGPDMYSK